MAWKRNKRLPCTYVFVNFISFNEAGRHLMYFNEAGRHLMYFGKLLFSGGSYVSDCLAVILGVSSALTVMFLIIMLCFFFLSIGQNVI